MANRTRKFDWNEAKRLRGEGLSYTAIAARLGVSRKAVSLACDPWLRDRERAASARWKQGGTCPRCGTQTSRLRKGADHHCRQCARDIAAETG